MQTMVCSLNCSSVLITNTLFQPRTERPVTRTLATTTTTTTTTTTCRTTRTATCASTRTSNEEALSERTPSARPKSVSGSNVKCSKVFSDGNDRLILRSIIEFRVIQRIGYVGPDKICWCLRGPIEYIFVCITAKERVWRCHTGNFFSKAIIDLVQFGNARHILYHLKINSSTDAVTPTNRVCSTFTTVQLEIFSGEYRMKAIF